MKNSCHKHLVGLNSYIVLQSNFVLAIIFPISAKLLQIFKAFQPYALNIKLIYPILILV